MKLVYTGEGIRQYMSRKHHFCQDISKYEILHRASLRISKADLKIGDNILVEYGDSDIFYILKIESISTNSIDGIIMESNTSNYHENDYCKLDCTNDDYFYVIGDEYVNKSFDYEIYFNDLFR